MMAVPPAASTSNTCRASRSMVSGGSLLSGLFVGIYLETGARISAMGAASVLAPSAMTSLPSVFNPPFLGAHYARLRQEQQAGELFTGGIQMTILHRKQM